MPTEEETVRRSNGNKHKQGQDFSLQLQILFQNLTPIHMHQNLAINSETRTEERNKPRDAVRVQGAAVIITLFSVAVTMQLF